MPPSVNKKKIVLDDDERFALMKFRRSVSDVLQPHHDDHFLLRWLRARNWNPEGAEKMLRQSLQWRKDWEIDGALKTWDPPEPIKSYQPSGISGYDKDGAPVIIVPFAGLDTAGILHSASQRDCIRATAQLLEKYLDVARETGTNELVVIFDMDNFNLRQYIWRPAVQTVIQLLQMYESNYPEILKICYIINAPRVFAFAFNVVKKFIGEYTIKKIKIYKHDPKKWQMALLENIEPDNLPKYLGGTLCDPDGNPKLITKIKQGGKVPKSYYKKQPHETGADDPENTYSTAVIKKGDKLTLDFIVAEPGSVLRWDFRSEDHDIGFSITVKDESGKSSSVVPYQRVPANLKDETGVMPCQAPATYTVTFDNSYSMMRNKKLHYIVEIRPPVETLMEDIDVAEDIAQQVSCELTGDHSNEIFHNGDANANGKSSPINGSAVAVARGH